MSEEHPHDEGHEHTVECGRAYFAAGGRWRKLRHPRAWTELATEDRMRTWVREGSDSPEAKKLYRRALGKVIACMVVLFVAIYLLPDVIGWLVALTVLSTVMRYGTWRDHVAARNYREGWIEGRQMMIEHVLLGHLDKRPVPGEPIEVDVPAMMNALAFENHRDMEVVMGLRTAQVPDDLSGLEP